VCEKVICARDRSHQGRDRGSRFWDRGICQSARDEPEALMVSRSLETETSRLRSHPSLAMDKVDHQNKKWKWWR